jgi:hypothetical protein
MYETFVGHNRWGLPQRCICPEDRYKPNETPLESLSDGHDSSILRHCESLAYVFSS